MKLASVDQFVPDYQTAVTLYGAEFIARKPEAARHFMRALIRAMRWYNDSLTDGRMQGAKADRLVEIMTKYGTVKNPAIWRAMVATGVDPDGHVNLASLRASWQFFRDTRQIDGSVTVDDVVDLRFLDQALAELGPYHRQ